MSLIVKLKGWALPIVLSGVSHNFFPIKKPKKLWKLNDYQNSLAFLLRHSEIIV